MLGLDQDRARPRAGPGLPQVRAERRGQAAHAALREDVGGALAGRQLVQDLVDHHRVALHDVARDAVVAGIGRVGDDLPAVGGRVARGDAHGVVVAARRADDLGAERAQRGLALGADGLVDVEHAAQAGAPRAPGHRAAVVARRRARHGERRRVARGALGAGGELFGRGEQAGDGVGAAQRLEAVQAEARVLVLVPDARDAGGAGEVGQRVERRGRVAGPAGDLAPGAGRGGVRENRAQRVVVGCVERGSGGVPDDADGRGGRS